MSRRVARLFLVLGAVATSGLSSSGCAGPQAAGAGASPSEQLLAPHEPTGGACPACPACPVLDTKMISEAQRIDAENVENATRVVRLEKTVDDLRDALARAEEKTTKAQAAAAAAADEAERARAAQGKPGKPGKPAKGAKVAQAAKTPEPVEEEEEEELDEEEPAPPPKTRPSKKGKKPQTAQRQVAPEETAERTRPAFEASNVATSGHKVRVRLSQELLFKLGGVRISRAGRRALAEIADVLKRTPSKRIEVCGHADTTGISQAWEDNWQISLERAHRVVAYLVARGVEPQRLVAMGFADTDPVAGNDTREGREKNRRVEIFIEPTGGAPAANVD